VNSSISVSAESRESSTSALFQEHLLSLETRPNDLDSLGHVNHAVVLEYFEAARVRLARELGFPEQSKLVVVVSRIEVDYLAEIGSGCLLVSTRIVDLPDDFRDELNYKLMLEHTLTRPGRDGALAPARVSVAFIARETRALVSFQQALSSNWAATE
jgi:acyl-CoA thioester hydrolase